MRLHNLALLLLTLCVSQSMRAQGLYTLPSEYDPNLENVCFKAQNQYAMDYDVANKNLEDIYQALNFYGNKIEVIVCTGIRSSALAYLNPSDGKKYILINPGRLTNINTRYYAHMFVIAHEFAHHMLNHFGSTVAPTQANKRKMELQADTYGASLVKKLGGSKEDCFYALENMTHPVDDTNADHPTKAKRIDAVIAGFNEDVVDNKETHSTYSDFFQDFHNISLTRYVHGINPLDISYYFKKTGMFPKSILYFGNSYWIYWEKNTDLNHYAVRWNYDYLPEDEIEKYLQSGYNIEFLERMNGKWFVVLLKYTSSFSQKIMQLSKTDFYNQTENYDDLKTALNNGFCVQNIIDRGDGDFEFLLTKLAYTNDGYYQWATRRQYDNFETWFKSKDANGYNYMYTFKYIDNRYFGFMLQSTNVKNWSIVEFDGNNIENVKKYLNDGYSIENITADSNGIQFTVAKY